MSNRPPTIFEIVNTSNQEEIEKFYLKAKNQYYAGVPILTDREFDLLENSIKTKYPDSKVLSIIGHESKGKIKHIYKMLSIQKFKSIDKIEKWKGNKKLLLSHKIDGLSVELVYDNNQLISASTRGDGTYGDDILKNILYVKDIPKKLSVDSIVVVHGELYMEKDEFNRINLKSNNKYNSPRNLAVGTITAKDNIRIKNRTLKFMAFEISNAMFTGDLSIIHQVLNELGFDTPTIGICENMIDFNLLYERWSNIKDELPYEVDGIVFAYNNENDRKNAGETDHHPKWCGAIKYETGVGQTAVVDIEWQVGKSGVVTPVAILMPIKLSNATISRATVHNAQTLLDLGISDKSIVEIIRSGEIIPKITKVILKGSKMPEIPENCPLCNTKLEWNGPNVFCTNKKCHGIIAGTLQNWINILDIKGLGQKSIDKMIKEWHITEISELYLPQKSYYVKLFGKNGAKIYDNLNNNKNITLAKYLAAINIPSVGLKVAKEITIFFKDYKDIQDATIGDLCKIPGISTIIAENIIDATNEDETYKKLLGLKLTIKNNNYKPTIKTSGRKIHKIDIPSQENPKKNTGQRVYITGSVADWTKSDLETYVTTKGFIWHPRVNTKLDILVIGNNPGKKRQQDAHRLNVKIMSWSDFNSIIHN